MKYNAKLVTAYWGDFGIPKPVEEFKFHDTRKWRFDFAFVDIRLAIEVEGGIFTQGRHSRGIGMLGDMEKYNTATSMGWRILRFPPSHLLKKDTALMIKNTIERIKIELVCNPNTTHGNETQQASLGL